jgi:hypothetical protein
MPESRQKMLYNILRVGALAVLNSAPVVLVLILVFLVPAAALFLRWFVALTSEQREDVIRLIRNPRHSRRR